MNSPKCAILGFGLLQHHCPFCTLCSSNFIVIPLLPANFFVASHAQKKRASCNSTSATGIPLFFGGVSGGTKNRPRQVTWKLGAPPLGTRRTGSGKVQPRGPPLGPPELLGPRRAPQPSDERFCLISKYMLFEVFEEQTEIYLAEMHLTMVFKNQIKNSL